MIKTHLAKKVIYISPLSIGLPHSVRSTPRAGSARPPWSLCRNCRRRVFCSAITRVREVGAIHIDACRSAHRRDDGGPTVGPATPIGEVQYRYLNRTSVVRGMTWMFWDRPSLQPLPVSNALLNRAKTTALNTRTHLVLREQ